MIITLARPSLYRHSQRSFIHASSWVSQSVPEVPRKPSSVPAGVTLKGINFIKDGTDPVALEDTAYPTWLWDLLDDKKQKQKTTKPVHRQFHRKQNRDAIKLSNFMKDKKT